MGLLIGYQYVQLFTDDYSNAIFVYFPKTNADTVQATKKFTDTQEVQECTEKPQEQSVKSRTPKDDTFDFDREGSSETNNLSTGGRYPV